MVASGKEASADGGLPRARSALGAVLSRIHVIAILSAVGALSGAVVAQVRTKTYRAAGLVLLGRPSAGQLACGPEEIRTFALIARSRAVCERAALRLRLGAEGPLRGAPDPVRALQECVSAGPLDRTRILEIGCETTDAAWAAELANAVSEAFVAELQDLARRQLVEGRAAPALGASGLDERLRSAEEELLRFQEEHAIVPSEDPLAGLRQTEAQLIEQLSAAQRERIAAEARLRRLPSADAPPDAGLISAAAAEDPWVRQLVEERLRQAARVLEMRGTLLDGHKDLESAKARLEQVERELAGAVRAFAASSARACEAARWKEAELARLLDEHRGRLAEARRNFARYDALRQRRDVLRSLLAPPASEVSSAREHQAAVIVDRARPPTTHARPRRLAHVLAGLAAGLAAGFVAAAFRSRPAAA